MLNKTIDVGTYVTKKDCLHPSRMSLYTYSSLYLLYISVGKKEQLSLSFLSLLFQQWDNARECEIKSLLNIIMMITHFRRKSIIHDETKIWITYCGTC